LSEVCILDVGHGNSAVLHDRSGIVVIDGGSRQTLLQYLKGSGVTSVDVVLVSHADLDHIGGILELLLAQEIVVKEIYLNPDAKRRTDAWKAIRIALEDARTRNAIKIHTQLTTTCTEFLDRGEVRLEVLAPSPIMAMSGVGGQDLRGEDLTANSMSAVVRILTTTAAEILLAGDMDTLVLEDLLARGVDLRARVLVFPHHGGLPGKYDAGDFARRLCDAVRPDLVVFSLGREGHRNPHPEIIAGVLEAAPNAHIACTQLSKLCAAELPKSTPTHLGSIHAGGRTGNRCCAGTIQLRLGAEALSCIPILPQHAAFVEAAAPNALCRGRMQAPGDVVTP
jgi:beta-lactamase superfamily II metal-dependent hydrolase